MIVPDWLVALVLAAGFLAVAARMLRGESLVPMSGGRDTDRVAKAGPGSELVLAVFAAARLATVPSLRPIGFLLLASAAGLAAFGSGARQVSQLLLVLLGAIAGKAAFSEILLDPCGSAPGGVGIVVAVGVLLVAVTVMAARLILGGWLAHGLDPGAAALGLFALLELAPVAVMANGVPLLGNDTPSWGRLVLVFVLLAVAVGVGLRPRFSAGALAVALAALTLGFLTASTDCGVTVGWVITGMIALAVPRLIGGALRRFTP